ncbi:MAG: hypothetical protein JRI68_26290 [Deltaproteobacteria bacterium]|nr:hypothetical protein [Deltaproteobacteria bacterium]
MRAFFAYTVLTAVLVASACTLNTEGGLAVEPTSSGQGAGGSTSSSSGTGGDGGTTSGTGGTTSSSGTGGSTGGDGGTGASEPENCLDGEDNDGDQDVDCADTDCQPDFECVPEAPSNWIGYAYAATLTAPAPAAVPCPDNAQPAIHFTTPSGPAQCDACTCGAVQGTSCGYPEMQCYYQSNSCGGGVDGTFTDTDGACHNFGGSWVNNNNDSCIMSQPAQVTSSGSCTAAGGTATVPAPWGAEVRSCVMGGTFGAGCNSGEVCVPSAGTDYPRICVTRAGDYTCPNGWSGETAYGGANDTRDCSACSCGSASGVSCSAGWLTVWDANGCQWGGWNWVDVSQTCVNVSDYTDNSSGSYEIWSGTATGGSCAPGGGQPTGDINASDPFTVCCLQ